MGRRYIGYVIRSCTYSPTLGSIFAQGFLLAILSHIDVDYSMSLCKVLMAWAIDHEVLEILPRGHQSNYVSHNTKMLLIFLYCLDIFNSEAKVMMRKCRTHASNMTIATKSTK
jgi:hypothetical protein